MSDINQMVTEGFSKYVRDAKISTGHGSFKDHMSQAGDNVKVMASKAGKATVKYLRDNPDMVKGAGIATSVIGAGHIAKRYLDRRR